jgi:hypothetical protein
LPTVSGGPDLALVDEALKDILNSASFRSSKQCQALLRYIVDNTLAHNEGLLRERVIGVEVFGRAPDYDTGNDPIVRARAAEVRKRLAQHYLHLDSPVLLRIDIPSGSYRATFDLVDKPIAAAPAGDQRVSQLPAQPAPLEVLHGIDHSAVGWAGRRRRLAVRIAIAALALSLLCCSALWLARRFQNPNERVFRQFWAPIIDSRRPVVIYIGANYSYRLTTRFLDEYRRQRGLVNTGPEFFIDLRSGEKIDESDLIPDNRLIGFGDVASASRVISTLTRLNKSYDLRYGNDISFSDLHASPALLIGGFSNTWTLEVTRNLRYSLEQGDRIVDRKDPNKVWLRKAGADGRTEEDYAVISRLPRSETGDFVLAIGGIDTFSNQAAADFLSDPEQVGAMLRTAPLNWENRNLQIVLHTSAVKEVPAVANVEAVNFW